MDEIEYKLNTNHSVLVVNAIDKLISTIKLKYKPAERQKFALENEELKFLRLKCSSKETMVSLTACQGLLALVELGVLEIAHTMSTVVTLLPTAKNYSAIISTMAGLLILDLKSRLVPGQPYKCQFNLKSPQHPFITVLQRNQDAEDDVMAQMQALCNHPDYIVSSNSLELLKPVFLWLTCNPQRASSIRPWQLLLSLPETPAQSSLLLACISCQQICNPKLVDSAFAAYSAVCEAAMYRRQWDLVAALMPVLARISNEQILAGSDPRACYSLLSRCARSSAQECRHVVALVVSLLAYNLNTSSALYLHELFNLCLTLISNYDCSILSLNTFTAMSLQWLHLPSYLTSSALKTASQIVDNYQNNKKKDSTLHTPNLKTNKIFNKILNTDRKMSVMFKLFQTWERLRDDPKKIENWLASIETTSNDLKTLVLPFLLGLLMEKNVEGFDDVKVKTLKIVVDLIDFNREVGVMLLPVLMFKVANDDSPIVRVECLKAIPLMAKIKENVPTIVSFLNKLKTGKGVPTSFLIMLYTSLAEIQARCFPYLKEVLLEGVGRSDDLKWEIDIAKATAVKRICELRPSSHGVELVSSISSILSRSTGAPGAPAASLALAGLQALWRSSAVSAASTWALTGDRLARDGRVPVQLSLCKLLSEIPSLRVTSPEFDVLLSSTARVLWTLLADSHEPAVAEAACDALAEYALTDYTLKHVPEIYRTTVKLPSSYCKTPVDAARKPEDVLDYIPCEVWPEVFKHTNQAALPGVERFLTRLLSVEVSGYRSGVYQPDARVEPQDLHYLQNYSRVRGLLTCLQQQARSPSYDFANAALLSLARTLSSPLPRPLPPLDLCFLQELCHRSQEWKVVSITLAARQATTSGSARRLVENYLAGIVVGETKEEEILFIFDILPILCRGLPPNCIRQPITQSLSYYFNQIANVKHKDNKDRESYTFVKLLKKVKDCLDNNKIHEANYTLLSQILESFFITIPVDHISWCAYARTCSSMSNTCLERMTSPSGWWESPKHGVMKAFTVRAELAIVGGLVWLNELIDAQAGDVTGQEYSLKCLYSALRKTNTDDTASVDWFLQLMARTQVAFKETEDINAKLYLCDVLLLSAVVLSGHWSFEPDSPFPDTEVPDIRVPDRSVRLQAFPGAIVALFARKKWAENSAQILEWLSHTRDSIPDDSISECCQNSLLAMRHVPQYTTHRIWIRLESHFGKRTTNVDE